MTCPYDSWLPDAPAPIVAVEPELYRPSSGQAGEWFISEWCANCERDKLQNGSKTLDECGPGDICQILGSTMFLDEDDPHYPREWIDDPERGPCCTAFVELGQPQPPARDTQTIDMFEMPDQGEE